MRTFFTIRLIHNLLQQSLSTYLSQEHNLMLQLLKINLLHLNFQGLVLNLFYEMVYFHHILYFHGLKTFIIHMFNDLLVILKYGFS